MMLFLAGAVVGQSEAPDSAFVTTNGRFWVQLTHDEKLVYVVAVQSAANGFTILSILQGDEPFLKNFSKLSKPLLPAMRNTETVGELDLFYDEAANAPIFIFDAMRWVSNKAGGMSKAELEDMTKALRSIAATVSQIEP